MNLAISDNLKGKGNCSFNIYFIYASNFNIILSMIQTSISLYVKLKNHSCLSTALVKVTPYP